MSGHLLRNYAHIIEQVDVLVVYPRLCSLLRKVLGDMIGLELIPGDLLYRANGCKVFQKPGCVR
jgi:hypothetical protein